ncbi:MAG: ABC transporter family substrate-binding protein [Acidimicrobiales bacterium]|nr:ABC transporter family substrate-binding protein [Acidimicrobiales bacterium]
MALVAAAGGYLVQLLVGGGADRVRNAGMVVAVPTLPTNLNPATPEGNTSVTDMVAAQIWPQPFMLGDKKDLVADRTFLSSAEVVSLKPQKVLYQIQPRAVWSDGVPITASDFIEAWREQRAEIRTPAEDPTLAQGYADIASIKSSQHGRWVTVVFKKPFADWEALFNNLLPAHVVRPRGWAKAFTLGGRTPMVSGGPFMVASYQAGRRLVLRRNPRYWGPAAGLARITFEQLSGAKYVDALRSGAVQMVVPPADPALVQAIESVPGIAISRWTSLAVEHLALNQTTPWMADPVIRRAVTMAIDRVQLETATVGRYDPSLPLEESHVFVPGESQYQDDGAAYESSSGSGDPPAVLGEVEGLFASVGFHLGPSGYLQQGGENLTLRLLAEGTPLQRQLASLVAGQLRAAGVQVAMEVMNGPAFRRALAGGQFDLALVVAQTSVFPSYVRAMYGTAGVNGGGSQNYTGYSSLQVDSLFNQAAGQLDPARAATTYNEIDQLLWSDLDTLPMFQLPGFVAYSPRYAGVDGSPGPVGPFWDASTWVELPASQVAHRSE